MPSAPIPTHHDHRGILRHTNCGSIRIATNIGRSAHGTHTVRRRLANARTVAAATWSGVLDNGAGVMPSVMRPITNPGRTTNRCTPDAVQGVGEAAAEAVQAGLGRPVHVIGAAHPDPGHRREHHDRSGARRPHGVGQHRQQADLGDEIRVHDGRRVPRILLRAGLVAQDAERQHRGADRAVLGDDRFDQWCMGRKVVGIEFAHVHSGGPGGPHGRGLVVELVGATRRQQHRRAGRQPRGQLQPDFAAATENHDQPSVRVLHGCDYVLRYREA